MRIKTFPLFSLLAVMHSVLLFFSPQALAQPPEKTSQEVQATQQEPVLRNEKIFKPTVLDQIQELPLQTPAPIKTEKIDKAGEKISNRIDRIGQKIPPLLGKWLNTELLWTITWLELGFCASLLVLVLFFERLVHFLIKRRLRIEKEAGSPASWYPFLLGGVAKPVALFIWVYGTYGALSVLFSHLEQPGLPQLIHRTIKWCADVGGTIAALWFVYRLFHFADFQLNRWARSMPQTVSTVVLALSKHLRAPVRMLIFLLFFRLTTPLFDFGEHLQILMGQVFGLLFIGAITWLTIKGLSVLEETVLSYYKMDEADNLEARKMHTQVRFLKRLAITLILILASGSMLMLFDKVRQLGTSILASAGILGIVIGLAAQRSISNILVGLQIAITQPIRLDDVVIVENEWGRIEEISTTYVVVKIWDLRRLIVPTSYFTEKPFQNWTRVSAELLGTVFLYVDYTVPIEALRQELQRILQASKLWNGKVGQVQVTNTTAQCMEVRLLLSANDASLAWDLRCDVREKMITFLQQHYPQGLAKIRAELQPNSTGETMAEAAMGLVAAARPTDKLV